MPAPSRSTEDVLKLIEHVSYRKTEGRLYLMEERLGWMSNTADTFKISEPYQNIRAQRISPAGKEKVQLQLLIHPSSSHTFHFINPNGKEVQMSERDDVKNILQKLLPRFRDKAHAELDDKNKILESNPQIVDLYKELVTNKYLCTEEFWDNVKRRLDSVHELDPKLQLKGIPTSFLSTTSIKTQKLDLNEEMIDDICSVFPSVKTKYEEILNDRSNLNPDKKQDFWTKFFQSHYFHKMRTYDTTDIFSTCGETDYELVRQEAERIQRLKASNFLQLESASDDREEMTKMDQLPVPDEPEKPSSSANLIHRYNQHYFFLLRTMLEQRRLRPEDEDEKAEVDLDAPPAKKRRLEEEVDLIYDEEQKIVHCRADDVVGVPFNSTQVSEYINRVSSNQLNARLVMEGGSKMGSEEARRSLLSQVKSMLPSSSLERGAGSSAQLSSSAVSSSVLTSIGYMLSGPLKPDTSHKPRKNEAHVPPEVSTAYGRVYAECQELLRHFWSCFPVTSNAKFERLHRALDSLHRFRDSRLRQFDQAQSQMRGGAGVPSGHLRDMIRRAEEAKARYLSNYHRVSSQISQSSARQQ